MQTSHTFVTVISMKSCFKKNNINILFMHQQKSRWINIFYSVITYCTKCIILATIYEYFVKLGIPIFGNLGIINTNVSHYLSTSYAILPRKQKRKSLTVLSNWNNASLYIWRRSCLVYLEVKL